MAIKRYAGDRFVGLSSDIKPTDIEDGAIFYEENTLKQYQLISSVWTEIISATTNFNTSLYITGTNIDSTSQTTGVLNRGLRLDAGEGFSIYGNRDFFGSFQDAIIFQMEDGNAASGTTDGGFVFRGFSPTANFPVANNWMTVRSPGRVGINKMIPTYSLDVFGNAYIQSGAVFAGGFVAEANSTIESDLQVDNNLTVLQRLGISGNLNANLIPTGTVIFADASKNLTGISHFSYIRMGQTGFFGINTPNPTQSLDVSGRVRIRGGSPDSGKVLVSVDSSGNAIWENASNLVSGDFNTIANNLTLTGITLWNRDLSISGGLESRIFQTGAAAITFANGIGTNLSGNLTQTGITLWNRDAAISGGIETRIFTSGAAAVAYAASYANGIGSNLSGNLTQTGITLWNRDASISGGLESRIFSTGAAAVTFATSYTNSVGTSLSGDLTQTGAVLFARDAAISGGLESRIFSTGAAAITFSTSYANTVGTNLSGNLTQTGATLFARDASISGGLEARIFSTGAAAITFATSYANGVGTNLSGNLTSTGSILHNRIIALSGFLTGNYVDGGGTANYIPRWGDFNTLNDSAIYQNGSSISIGWTGGIAPLDILGNINIRTGYINLINGDINFQQGEHLGSSSAEYIGPAGLIDLIHVLGNGIGVNDPIRFRPIYNKECYSGGVWIPDPNSGIISYERLIDNAAYAPVGILTQMETSVGISGKRFTLDLQNTYIRPNIITMSKGWNQSHWEYTPIIESGASTSSFNVIVSGSNLTRSNGAGTKLFYLGNVNEARYLRFSFLSTEHINTGNLSIGKIRGYGNQYSSSVTIQPLQVDSGRNVFISNKLNIGDTSIRSAALNVGTSSTSASQGLSFGADSTANLYRSAASTVKTDGYFVSEAGITSNGVIFANDDIECIANISSNYLDVTQNIQTNDINVSRSGTFSGIRISGGSPALGKVLSSIDSFGNTVWSDVTSLPGIVSSGFITGISGFLSNIIANTGQQAWQTANNNSINLSGNLTQTGITLWNRDAAISGGLEARINATGAATVAFATSYANAIGVNLSGNLTQTGITLWNRDTAISGGLESRIFSTGAAAVTFAVSHANAIGVNLSGNLTQTGATLFARDAAISGGLEARIFATGSAAIAYSNSVGVSTSGSLHSSGQLLNNKINALSGTFTGTSTYFPIWTNDNSFVNSVLYQKSDRSVVLSGQSSIALASQPYVQFNASASVDGRNLIRSTNSDTSSAAAATAAGFSITTFSNTSSQPYESGQEAQILLHAKNSSQDGRLRIIAPRNIHFHTSAENVVMTGSTYANYGLESFIINSGYISGINFITQGGITGRNLQLSNNLSVNGTSQFNNNIDVLGNATADTFTAYLYYTGNAIWTTNAHFSGFRLYGQSTNPISGHILSCIDADGNAIWISPSNISGLVSSGFIINISGALASLIAATGQQAWQAANNNAINISGNLTQSGVTLWNRDAAISGGLEARIFTSGAAAINYASSYSNGIGVNLSGNLTQTGITLLNRDIAISGGIESRIFSTGAASIAFATSFGNGIGTNLSGNLTQTGIVLWDRDASISGGLEARIFTSGLAAVSYASSYSNGVGTNLSGDLTSTGSTLHNRLIALSGFLTGNYVDGNGTANYLPRWSDTNTLTNSTIYQNGTSTSLGWIGGTSTLDISGTTNFRSGNITLIGADIGYQAGRTIHLGQSYGEYNGPQSLIDIIHALSNGVGVNDPLRFRPILSKDYYSGGVWYTDPAGPSFENCIDNRLTSVTQVISKEDCDVGISGKRFVLDLQGQYVRPNFITISPAWDQASWGCIPVLEGSIDNITYSILSSGGQTNRTANRIIGMYPGDIGANRYLRFSFLASEAITGASSSFSLSKIRSISNQQGQNRQPISIDSGRNIYFANRLNISGTSVVNSALNIGTSSLTTASNGLTFGEDLTANLYRSSAGTISTNASLDIAYGLTVGSFAQFNADVNVDALLVTYELEAMNVKATRSGIFSGIRISGGSPALGRVLQCNDAFGNATWSDPANLAGLSGANIWMQTGNILFPSGSSVMVGINTRNPAYNLQVNGSFAATTKSFDIPHPLDSSKRLIHGSLEGPEFGVYIRGKSTGQYINLPDYWEKLVDEETISVQLTPIGKNIVGRIRNYSVDKIEKDKIKIFTDSFDKIYNYYYNVYAERKDIPKINN